MHRVLEIYRFIHYLWIVSQGYKCCYLIVGYLAFRTPRSQTAASIHRRRCWAFHSATARVEYCLCQGSRSRPDSRRSLCAFSSFALFYEDSKGVSKQLSDPPEASPEKRKKPCPAFSWEPQIPLHTNFPLISWTVRNGKTLVLLWGEREFDWQGPALNFCWIKRG